MCILGGVEAPQWAVIFNPWTDEPVYHRLGVRRPWHGGDTTACGREVDAFKPWLPFKHVVKFGRPCKGCFPEGV